MPGTFIGDYCYRSPPGTTQAAEYFGFLTVKNGHLKKSDDPVDPG